jgi:hypothetical protein
MDSIDVTLLSKLAAMKWHSMAQLSAAEKGVVTTSEKYTIAHSNHVGLKFIALKWQNVPTMVDDGESLSDDFTYYCHHQ